MRACHHMLQWLRLCRMLLPLLLHWRRRLMLLRLLLLLLPLLPLRLLLLLLLLCAFVSRC